MQMNGVSLLGWLHAAACVIALLIGAHQLVAPKGTPKHRRLGRWYFYAMLVVTLSVFGIFHFDVIPSRPPLVGPNVFGIFHWEAVLTLLMLLIGFYAASRQKRAIWAYLHPFSMLFTYYMLVGGLINELFVRVDVLHAFAIAQSRGARNIAASPVVGMTQFAAMVLFLLLVTIFLVKVARYRRGARLSGVAAE
jgi:uncharacterized membrane protein